jgi:transcriptional regulator with XRE-family HTH domain
MNLATLRTRIRKHAKALGGQSALAARSGVTRQYLNAFLMGAEPSKGLLEALGVTWDVDYRWEAPPAIERALPKREAER